jgi:peroxiredoxin
MKKASRSYVVLGVGLAGFALVPLSPVAAAAVTGVALGLAFPNSMKFNVLASRIAQRTCIVLHALAVYLMSGSIALAAAAFCAGLAQFNPGEWFMKNLGGLPAALIRIFAGVAANVCLLLAWPFGWSALVLLPPFLIAEMAIYFNIGALAELRGGRPGKVKTQVRLFEPAPEFELPRRRDGSPFRLADEKGRHILLCFLRGDWCPFCQVLMRIYRKAAPVLAEHGVKLVMINPSSGEEAKSFAEEMNLDYEILVDADLALATKLGIVGYDKPSKMHYPLPVSFLVDQQGIVRHIFGFDDTSILDTERISAMLKTPTGAAPAAA